MDSPKINCKKGLLLKTWNRCKSFSGGTGRKGSGSIHINPTMRSKSWPRGCVTTKDHHQYAEEIKEKSVKGKIQVLAPEGCISIYVGVEKERFVMRTECVNHPLFKVLLEEAESEYGYNNQGPLLLPCQVDQFIKVIMEMDFQDKDFTGKHYNNKGCNFLASTQSSYHHLSRPIFVAFSKYNY